MLHLLMQRVVRIGPGAWDFAILGVDVVDLDLQSFTVAAVLTLSPATSLRSIKFLFPASAWILLSDIACPA